MCSKVFLGSTNSISQLSMKGLAENRPSQFYKYVSADTAKLILKACKLRWSSPLAFNDVFDVPAELPAFSVREIEYASIPFAVNLFDKVGLTRFSPEQREEAIALCRCEELLSVDQTDRAEVSLEALRSLWRKTVPTMRILCFCEYPDIAAMWGLYADSNKGVVLRFDSFAAYFPPWLLAKPVTYTDTLPRFLRSDGIMEAAILGPQALFDDLCYKKTTDWAYEREWRVLSFAGCEEMGLSSDWKFAPETLTEIIVGPRISDQNVSDIAALLMDDFSHVRLSRAIPTSHNTIQIQTTSKLSNAEL